MCALSGLKVTKRRSDSATDFGWVPRAFDISAFLRGCEAAGVALIPSSPFLFVSFDFFLQVYFLSFYSFTPVFFPGLQARSWYGLFRLLSSFSPLGISKSDLIPHERGFCVYFFPLTCRNFFPVGKRGLSFAGENVSV